MNKIDLIDKSLVKEEEAEDLAAQLRLPLYKTSVKDNLNISETFETLAIEFFRKG